MPKDTNERDELAFRLYAERIAKGPAQINGEEATRWAYRQAEAFLSMRDKIAKGEPVEQTGPKLSDASAPNLPAKHPHNLVSQRFGNEPTPGVTGTGVDRIKHILAWLDKNPRNEQDPVAYKPLDWDVPTTNLARVIFPAYVSN